MNVILMILCLAGGFVLLVKGADLFVDGACAISEKLKIPAYLVGLTVVALGTSLPEAAVSITASIQGSNEIAIGNVIGSNTFNTLVVLGASALIAPVAVKKNILKRDFPFCIFITAVLLILMITLNGGDTYAISRVGGVILLVLFTAFMTFSIVSAKKTALPEIADNIAEKVPKKEMSALKCVLLVVLGIAGVIAGGELTVYGAKSLALMAGLSEKVVALTVVAIGTSLPELVTSIVAARKKQNDIAVGNVIGSNIFNILFILGISAAISPIPTDVATMIDGVILTGFMVITFIFALFKKKITRIEGLVMILLYVAYTVYLLVR